MPHKQCEHIIPTETRGTHIYTHVAVKSLHSSTENRGIRIPLQQVSTLKIKCVAYTYLHGQGSRIDLLAVATHIASIGSLEQQKNVLHHIATTFN